MVLLLMSIHQQFIKLFSIRYQSKKYLNFNKFSFQFSTQQFSNYMWLKCFEPNQLIVLPSVFLCSTKFSLSQLELSLKSRWHTIRFKNILWIYFVCQVFIPIVWACDSLRLCTNSRTIAINDNFVLCMIEALMQNLCCRSLQVTFCARSLK